MSGDDSSLSLRAPVRETVFRPFPLASPSGALYIERMFLLRLCINKPIHYLRLYRSLYSNTMEQGHVESEASEWEAGEVGGWEVGGKEAGAGGAGCWGRAGHHGGTPTFPIHPLFGASRFSLWCFLCVFPWLRFYSCKSVHRCGCEPPQRHQRGYPAPRYITHRHFFGSRRV